MKLSTLLVITTPLLLTACGGLSIPFMGGGDNQAQQEASQASQRMPDDIICTYQRDAMNLPIKLDTYRAISNAGLSDDPRLSISIDNDKREIVKLNLKHECLCGTPQRKRQLQCDNIDAAGAELEDISPSSNPTSTLTAPKPDADVDTVPADTSSRDRSLRNRPTRP